MPLPTSPRKKNESVAAVVWLLLLLLLLLLLVLVLVLVVVVLVLLVLVLEVVVVVVVVVVAVVVVVGASNESDSSCVSGASLRTATEQVAVVVVVVVVPLQPFPAEVWTCAVVVSACDSVGKKTHGDLQFGLLCLGLLHVDSSMTMFRAVEMTTSQQLNKFIRMIRPLNTCSARRSGPRCEQICSTTYVHHWLKETNKNMFCHVCPLLGHIKTYL